MVGGSTRIPLVSDMIADFIDLQPHLEIDSELCVAMGASVQAGIIAGEPIDSILVDVAPHSLGVEVAAWDMGGPMFDQYSVIIGRNTPVPVSKSEVYTTLTPNQEIVEIKVYQGEEPIAPQNTFLGEFRLEGIKRTKRGEPEIVVNFDYNVNGMVRISAQDKETGREKEIAVTASLDRLTEEQKTEATERFADMVIAWDAVPTDSHEEAVILRERSIEVAESLDAGVDKTKLQELISELDSALNSQNEEAINSLQDEILDFLYDLEDESVR